MISGKYRPALVFLTVAAFAPSPAAAGNDAEVLSTVRAVRTLSPEAAAKGRAAKLRGVVLVFRPAAGDFFLNDATGSIYVAPQRFVKLAAGDLVEVEGRADPGEFAPCVSPTSVARVGTSPLPDPFPYDLNRNDSRWLDAVFVQAWGVVESVAAHGGDAVLEVRSLGGRAGIYVAGLDHLDGLKALRGRSVKARGVCVPAFDSRRVVDRRPRIFVSSPADIAPLPQSDVDHSSASVKVVEQLWTYSPDAAPYSRRVKLRAVVTAHGFDGSLFAADETAPVLILGKDLPPVPVGTRIEATGALEVQDASLRLESATVVPLGESGDIPPRRAYPAEAAEMLSLIHI